jgi:hypothetical protein
MGFNIIVQLVSSSPFSSQIFLQSDFAIGNITKFREASRRLFRFLMNHNFARDTIKDHTNQPVSDAYHHRLSRSLHRLKNDWSGSILSAFNHFWNPRSNWFESMELKDSESNNSVDIIERHWIDKPRMDEMSKKSINSQDRISDSNHIIRDNEPLNQKNDVTTPRDSLKQFYDCISIDDAIYQSEISAYVKKLPNEAVTLNKRGQIEIGHITSGIMDTETRKDYIERLENDEIFAPILQIINKAYQEIINSHHYDRSV